MLRSTLIRSTIIRSTLIRSTLRKICCALPLSCVVPMIAVAQMPGSAPADATAGTLSPKATESASAAPEWKPPVTGAFDIPAHGAGVALFDGVDLSGFDIFLKQDGLNNDPSHVFTVEKGVIHVSGTQMGYIITRNSYQRYYLRAEFKWGDGTFAPRAGQARDSGILYNIEGPQKVWPRSIEFQINEGATGDFWMTDGAALTGPDGRRVTGTAGWRRQDRSPEQRTVGECSGISRSGERVGAAARGVESAGAGERRDDGEAICERGAGECRDESISGEREDTVSIRGGGSILPEH